MPMSVHLDSKTEALVGRLAERRRQSKSAVVRDAIGLLAARQQVSKKKLQKKVRPYDLVKHLIGCASSGSGDLSTRTGDKFYEMLVADRGKRR